MELVPLNSRAYKEVEELSDDRVVNENVPMRGKDVITEDEFRKLDASIERMLGHVLVSQ